LRVLGFIIALAHWNSLEFEFSFYALVMLIVGIVLMFPAIITGGLSLVKK
jgi:hypothetical protein